MCVCVCVCVCVLNTSGWQTLKKIIDNMSNLYGILNSGEVPTHKPTQTHEGYSYTHVNTKAEG